MRSGAQSMQSPQLVFARLGLANFLWAAGKGDEAERELKAALALAPTSPTVNRALATLYIGQGRDGEAEPYLQTFAKESGTSESKLLLADYYVRARKLPEATGILTSLAAQEDSFVPATLRLAALDFVAGRRQEVYKRLDEVIARQPGNEPAVEAKARFFLLEGKNQEALALANSLVTANPRIGQGSYARGLALEATGSMDEAVKAYQEVLAIAPTSAAAQSKLATMYLTRRNSRDALQLSQQLVKAHPQSATAHFLYAKALLQSGDLANAERELFALAKADPVIR